MGMELGLAEMPLALFSTLAPMGAGTFTLLALAFCMQDIDKDVLKKIDRLTVIPVIILIVGFICAFFHLASPFNAFGVFNNLGSSPMSNEIAVGVIFCVIAIVYWIIAMAVTMTETLRRALSIIVAICGLVFCVFIGLAYGMNTIPTWDNAMVPLSTLFFGLFGGSTVGIAVLYSAGAFNVDAKQFNTAAIVVACVGAVGSALFFGLNMGDASGVTNNMMVGSDVVGEMMQWIICGIVVILLAAVGAIFELLKERVMFYPWIVVVVAFIGILIARLCFYGVEMSVGLGI